MPNCFSMNELRWKLLEEIVRKQRKVKDVAEILWVSRQSVSKWLWKYRNGWLEAIQPKKPWPKSGTCWNKTEDWLEDEICRLAKENPYEWPIWIRDEISDLYEVYINQATVYRILKRKKVRYYTWYHNSRKKRKLYVKDIPGRELQLDVSFPFWYQRPFCIYTIIDDASRFVYSKILHRHTEISTLKFLEEFFNQVPFKPTAIRTDQGREFSRLVTQYLKTKGIQHNKNPPYTPQHNGKVERYHRTMKEKCCAFWEFNADIEELNYQLKLWTDHYNNKKKHYWLGMNGSTPKEKLLFFKKQNPLLVPLLHEMKK